MVTVSVLIHAAVLAGVLTLAPMSDRPRRFYAPAMTVNLVAPGPARPAASPGKVEAAVTPPAPVKAKEPLVKVEPPAKPKVVEPEKPKAPHVKVAPPAKPKVVEPEKPKVSKPPAKEEAPKPEEADVQAGLQEIRERLAKARLQEGAGGQRGGVSSAILELRHKAYYNQIWQILEEAWVLPESVRGETLQAIVSIGIDPAGKVVEVQFERPSGDRYFDESVKRALAKVAQLPPPPEALPGGLFRVGLRFSPRLR